ncbi:MAG TPA: protein kinase, partial [Ktedonobacteraceae bacterium]|nr:protein kinase [Ktedonobacteraceae bacterium]
MGDRVGQQLGNYRLIRLIGEGGFAQVYLAEHLFLKRRAAVKVLHQQVTKDALEEFRREAEMIARLEHPNIVRVLEFGIEHNVPFLVMSYASNGTLRQRHREGSRLPLDT